MLWKYSVFKGCEFPRVLYKSYGVEAAACGITPEQEWLRDERGLVFLDVSVVAEAFAGGYTFR